MQTVTLNLAKVRKTPDRSFQTFPFSDPAFEDEIIIHLRKPSPGEKDAADEKADEYIAKFVTGGFKNELGVWCPEPMEFPMPDGMESPTIKSRTLYRLARIEAMQPEQPELRHSLDALVILSNVAEEAWPKIEDTALKVIAGLGKEEGQGKA